MIALQILLGMDWVDRPQKCKGFVWKFATFARLPFGQFSTENSQT